APVSARALRAEARPFRLRALPQLARVRQPGAAEAPLIGVALRGDADRAVRGAPARLSHGAGQPARRADGRDGGIAAADAVSLAAALALAAQSPGTAVCPGRAQAPPPPAATASSGCGPRLFHLRSGRGLTLC